jgi:hypothetical protein
VQRTTEYDRTPTLRLVGDELVVVPAWMDHVLDDVLAHFNAPATDRPTLFGEAS